ncbi:unnamed protein product [Symbiodinium natans]|uniref:Pentatricopeptide repeat-containing protein, chloroplastic n=1 Tax=Symbiodinium natans TaxID=878477 RepID=A0A812SKY9_9DINO|nr:unnamed protein product [Symbiodinium natans]
MLGRQSLGAERAAAAGWTKRVGACRRSGNWERALALLAEMELQSFRPDLIAISVAISVCEKMGRWEAALDLLWELPQRRFRADVVAYSSAVSSCSKAANWPAALQLLDAAQRDEVKPNSVTYNGAITACGRASEWKRALAMLEEAKAGRLDPEEVSVHTSAISACGAASQWQLAVALLQEAEAGRANVVLYNAAMCCGCWPDCRRSEFPLHLSPSTQPSAQWQRLGCGHVRWSWHCSQRMLDCSRMKRPSMQLAPPARDPATGGWGCGCWRALLCGSCG